MIEIPLDGLHDQAQERADAVPPLRRSMRGAAGNEVGAMGELVAIRYLTVCHVPYREDLTYNHDLIVTGRTVDVKTKERTVPPQANYDCTVPDYNKDWQQPEAYLFVSLLSDGTDGCHRFLKGWVLGTISAERFDTMAVRWTPNTTDLTNGWKPTIPCRNVKVSQLNPTLAPLS